MRPLNYFKTRVIKLEKMMKLAMEDLQGAEHDLNENPCKQTWETVESIEKKISLLDSEIFGVNDIVNNYDKYCYFEEQEEMMTAAFQENY